MLTPITVLSAGTAHKHMQNRLRNCYLGILDNDNETSVRLIETRTFWERHQKKLAYFVPEYLDSLFDIALHPAALAGEADDVTWCLHGGKRLAADGRTIWMEPPFARDDEYGHLESKLASVRAVELVGVMARQYPKAFNPEHVEHLLDIAGLTEGGRLGCSPDYSLYQTIIELSAHNPKIFTEDLMDEMQKRRQHSPNYSYAQALAILEDQRYELPLQGALSPIRPPAGEVIHVSFKKPDAPKPA